MCAQEAWTATTRAVSELTFLDVSVTEMDGALIRSFIQNYHSIYTMGT